MEFGWTDAQLARRASMARFGRELSETGHEGGPLPEGVFSREAWRRCAEFGVQGLGVPDAYGGCGVGIMTATLAMEGFGRGCTDNGLLLALNAQMWTFQRSILEFGTDEQKKHYLPKLCAGDIIGAIAITEPETGSDVQSLRSRAHPRDGGYVLTGDKTLITLAPVADVALVIANMNPQIGSWGHTAFLVERGTPGVEFGPVLDKMGLRSVPMGEITLRECFVPAGQRLGGEGRGAAVASGSIEWERSCMLASFVGAMERQLDVAVARARGRHQFGQAIGKFQSISNRIADMKARLEMARLMIYKVAWLKKTGQPATLDAALAKLALTEAFVESSLDAIRVQGGRGYMTDTGVERDLRDAVGGVLYGGTSDIQRQIVARLLGL